MYHTKKCVYISGRKYCMKNEVSLCMIVKNEEDYLPACLQSVKDVVDEIIIVDTGSQDKTVEIAQKFGAKVYYFKWNNNFSEARNESLKYASKDWILIMDADDEFYPEDKRALKVLLSGKLNENAVYYFETLSYCGDKIDDDNMTVNINPRLFKNNQGIHYEGEIHNQLICMHNECNIICNPIKIHHYGYLENRMILKDKRNRNITILNKQIKDHPEYKFAYFNLGNEYAASGDMLKALECYYKAYEDFEPERGFSPILLIRIVYSNYRIGKYGDALKFIDIGTGYFPECTDFYFFKAAVFKELKNPVFQIKALEKCIKIGEAPSQMKFLYGVGSFRAYYELGNAYMRLKDYTAAYNYYIEAVKSKSDFIDPLYGIAHILKEKNVPLNEFKESMEAFFAEPSKSYDVIADLFYNERYYETALEYVKKCEKKGTTQENVMMLKAKCLVRTGHFEECININAISEESSSYLYFSMQKVMSGIMLQRYDYAEHIINSFKECILGGYDKKMLKVYSELLKLFKGEPMDILTKNGVKDVSRPISCFDGTQDEKEYMDIILEICEIFLINNKFDELEIAVNLLNLTESKYSLLYLGKLYYKNGYLKIAKKEILRSIKEFEIYDSDGLDILKTVNS